MAIRVRRNGEWVSIGGSGGSTQWENITNRPPIEVSDDGYTDIAGRRKPTAINFKEDGCDITVEGGLVSSFQFITDEMGNITTIIVDGEHTVQVTGVS